MKTSILFSFALVISTYCVGQEIKSDIVTDSLTIFEFTLKDGSKVVGQLLDQNKEYYWVESLDIGRVKLEVNKVTGIVIRRQSTTMATTDKASFAYENQFGFKYLLVNTAIPAEPKKWYYTNQYLAFSGFTYGINKHLSAGVSFFTFIPSNFFSPNIKITLNPNRKFKIALAGQHYVVRNSNDFSMVQFLFSSGDAQNNFSFGYSSFFSSQEARTGSLLTFGFVKKVSNKVSVISENNVIILSEFSSKDLGYLSAGVRFDRRVHAFDLGIYVPTSDLVSNLSVIPYIGFNLRMNK
ncbi:MAG: hypothetical protein ACKO96_40645 [Flammeovirgaceae bacterium]